MIIYRIFRLFLRLAIMAIIYVLRLFSKHDTYVVAGMLFMPNVDPIDSWTFFQWLQKHNIPSRYLVNSYDTFYQNCIKGKGYKDIVVLEDSSKIIFQVKLWIRARAFASEWNLVSKTFDTWLQKMPGMRYVLLQHGITGTHASNIVMKGMLPFNDINVSSVKEKALIESFPGIRANTCFVAGLTRFDTLKNEADLQCEEKTLFVMFTWRSFRKGASFEEVEKSSFWQGITSLLSENNLKHLAEKKIKVVLAIHHSMPHSVTELQKYPNVEIAQQKDIKYWIKHSHAFLTDFSSVAFDFLFINKPVIFWIPDMPDQNHSAEDYEEDNKVLSAIERRKDFFNTADSIEDVMNLLNQYAENGFVLEKEKLASAQQWFANRADFSRLVYEAIEARIHAQ